LIAKSPPTVAFVDVKLRDGELAYDFIDRLHERGIRVIVTSAFAVLPERVEKIASVLPKPYTAMIVGSGSSLRIRKYLSPAGDSYCGGIRCGAPAAIKQRSSFSRL
jgi:hypothetical protein